MIRSARRIIILLFFTLIHNLTAQPLNILDHRELFVDHYLIEKMDNCRLVMHTPRDEGPVLQFDYPWEGAFCGYCTIIHHDDLYQLYYRGLPKAGKDGSDLETTCYAESKDGINWTKPDLGIYEIHGTRKNNVILFNAAPVTHNFSPFWDTNPNCDENQRYKALGGTSKSGMIPYVSKDGIHWQKMQNEAVFSDGKFDSQNVVFWSKSEQCYILYFREWTGDGYKGFRSVSRTTSKDFINWTEPVAMTFGDTPYEHLYTQQTSPYFRAPHLYVAIGARFMPDKQVLTQEQAQAFNVDPKYYKDCSDAIFMTSRGGSIYDRTFMESFIRPGIGFENWVSRSNYPVLNIVQTGDNEMSVYVNQNYAQPTANIHRYSMRLDGFSSIQAPYAGAEFITKSLIFEGSKLLLNYSTSAAGEIRIEIQDESGNAIQGLALDDCQTIIGNEINRTISWKGDAQLKTLQGKPIRLRFAFKDADIYSFKFEK